MGIPPKPSSETMSPVLPKRFFFMLLLLGDVL
jgi:hypothetical protein